MWRDAPTGVQQTFLYLPGSGSDPAAQEGEEEEQGGGASGIGAERNINQSGVTRVSAASGLWSTFTNRVPAPIRHP
ncbi:hypothetical protein CHARACLAT_012052 [Characodon lateralis]|uniref:Uncharacterized protein n=1 Tax=Characodon lateralis TaxID=208331 RepID=A0ABU7E9P6_9TELE|nr:hypothetical protein [Characodon lateralis]